MSQQLSQPATNAPVQKRKFDIYTMMLLLSFFLIVAACVLMAYELSLWGKYPMWKPEPTSTSINWVDTANVSVDHA